MKVDDNVVIQFINRYFPGEVFAGDEFLKFRSLAAEGKEIAAAEEYCKITKASIEEAHLAVVLAITRH